AACTARRRAGDSPRGGRLPRCSARRRSPPYSRRDPAETACRSGRGPATAAARTDRKSTRLNSSHVKTSYAVFCLKKKKIMLSLLLPSLLIMFTPSTFKRPVSSWKALNLRKRVLMGSTFDVTTQYG